MGDVRDVLDGPDEEEGWRGLDAGDGDTDAEGEKGRGEEGE